MAKQSLVLYRIAKLNPDKEVIESQEHVPRGCSERASMTAMTRLQIKKHNGKNKSVAGNYFEAEITHREGLPVDGYWHDQPIREVVSVSVLPVYYNPKREVFIIAAPASLASAAVRRLNKDCPDDVKLQRVKLDFDELLKRKKDLVVRSAWASTPNDRIRSRAAFSGEDLRTHEDFKRMSKAGQLSSMSIGCTFEDEEEMRANVSRSCGVFFISSRPKLDQRLRFIEHLAGFEAQKNEKKPKKAKAA